MTMLDGMYNCWVAYWGPGSIDAYGDEVPTDPPTVMKANWASGDKRMLTATGENYVVTQTVYTSSMTEPGGYLKKVSEYSLGTPQSVVESHILTGGSLEASYDSPPIDGQIRSVKSQSDLDNFSDVVYAAEL